VKRLEDRERSEAAVESTKKQDSEITSARSQRTGQIVSEKVGYDRPMFAVSSETDLLGAHPEGLNRSVPPDFASEVALRWRLAAVRRDPPAAAAPDCAPAEDPAPRRHEIIRGSTGSRIFELLHQLKPSPAARPAQADRARAPPDARGRKLQF
jgi:hypothetical protein